MGKININSDDINRILLTELLPFEVPMLFSNEGFYVSVSEGKHKVFFDRIYQLSKANGDPKKYGIPFNYEVIKNSSGDTRELSIIHPYNQLYFVDLYKKYNPLMLNLCSKSPFSLRKISKVAKYYYSPSFVNFDEEDGHKGAEKEIDADIIDFETKYLKSYFTYRPIDLIYKFYDSQQYRRLEQRFNYLLELDISKCFYNIYTHSVCWAIKDKESSKRNARMKSFENEFDKLMQLSNYNETNGIIVGPEISRIFAEIILQQIDVNIYNTLEKANFKIGEDYEIRRYVDDYFIFSNQEDYLFKIKKVIEKELKFYKLYLNSNKTENKSTPFISDITVGKRDLFNVVDKFFDEYIKISKSADDTNVRIIEITEIRKPYYISQNFIKDFQCIVKRNNIKYDLISKDVLREIKKQIVKVISFTNTSPNKNLENLLLLLLDIAFYAYSLNINSNTTFKISQIIILVCKLLNSKEDSLKFTIFSKIVKDTDFVLRNFQRKSKTSLTNIESINLLIAVKKVGAEFQFSNKRIKELFSISDESDYDRLNYFQIVSLLYYVENIEDYGGIKKEIEKTTIKRFVEDIDPFSKSEVTLLFFDFICCPFVSIESKRTVLKKSQFCKPNEPDESVDKIIGEIESQKRWFMDWDINIDLERVLKKKEWGLTY